MVIVLKNDIKAEQKARIKQFLADNNFKTNEVAGEESTIIAAVGKLGIDPRRLELMAGVSRVIPISKPYKMASREFKSEDTIVEVPNNRGQIIRIGGNRVIAIAGPCAVESREQMMDAAAAVSAAGAVMLRGGAYKPRSSPYSFQGLGEEGLQYLKEAGEKYGLPVVTEIVATEFIPVMRDYVDVYQVGARNMQNFELLKKLGALGKPVILKRGLSSTIEEWLMAAEYLLSSGTDKVILCERGIRTYERATRNTLDLSAIPILRGLTHLPVIVDPSHAVGIRDKVAPMALAAVAGGADGIIVEVHCNPDKALSDGAQSLYPAQFDKLMQDIQALAPVVGKQVAHIRSAQAAVHSSSDATESASEKSVRCAFCGKRGAYAEQAIAQYFDGECEAVAVDSFREIFQSVVDGKADFGMVPIENCLAGSVYENYDNLVQFGDIGIVGALTLRIQHALLGVKGAALSDVKQVYSHPQGLAQSHKFLSEHKDWKHIEAISTATAAKMVGEMGKKENAAIASVVTAGLYNLDILKEDIEDNAANYTRFVIIASNNVAKKPLIAEKPNTASFVFSVNNEPGALYNCLGIFQSKGLNLTRLESRPIAGKPWKYWFYADAELKADCADVSAYIKEIMDALREKAEDVRLLGIYSEGRR